MQRKGRWIGLVILLMGLPFVTNCISLKMVSVDQKTELENQILGSIGELQKDLAMTASVRGDGQKESAIPNAHREALMAMMNRQFNLDDVNDLKARQAAGENLKGLLTFFENERTKNDPNYKALAKRIIETENKDRTVIMRRVLSINPNLTDKDYPIVQSMMYKLNVQGSPPGVKIQKESGEWDTKPKPVE